MLDAFHIPKAMFTMPSGLVDRLKSSSQPVTDGQDHLIPLCETIEAILRYKLRCEYMSKLYYRLTGWLSADSVFFSFRSQFLVWFKQAGLLVMD